VKYTTEVFDQVNLKRTEKGTLSSSNNDVATFDSFGNLMVKKSGKTTLTASVEGISESVNIKALKNPVRKMTLSADKDEIRTGDVLVFSAKAMNRSGRTVEDVPVVFSYTGKAKYGIGLPASALINQDGKFVAETSGIFTVMAQSGGYSARKTVKVVPRNVKKKVTVVGHGTVKDYNTSLGMAGYWQTCG
jgi:hypothetical protein